MGLYEGRGNLNKGIKDLLLRWQNTRGEWADEVAQRFEEDRLVPLEMAVKQAVSGMDHMSQVMSKIDRDCR